MPGVYAAYELPEPFPTGWVASANDNSIHVGDRVTAPVVDANGEIRLGVRWGGVGNIGYSWVQTRANQSADESFYNFGDNSSVTVAVDLEAFRYSSNSHGERLYTFRFTVGSGYPSPIDEGGGVAYFDVNISDDQTAIDTRINTVRAGYNYDGTELADYEDYAFGAVNYAYDQPPADPDTLVRHPNYFRIRWDAGKFLYLETSDFNEVWTTRVKSSRPVPFEYGDVSLSTFVTNRPDRTPLSDLPRDAIIRQLSISPGATRYKLAAGGLWTLADQKVATAPSWEPESPVWANANSRLL